MGQFQYHVLTIRVFEAILKEFLYDPEYEIFCRSGDFVALAIKTKVDLIKVEVIYPVALMLDQYDQVGNLGSLIGEVFGKASEVGEGFIDDLPYFGKAFILRLQLVFVGELVGINGSERQMLAHIVMYLPAYILHGLLLDLQFCVQQVLQMLFVDECLFIFIL
jgi:hypothetical protein